MTSPRIALALDMDGVIIDSTRGKSETFVALFATRWPDWEARVRSYNEAHFGIPRAHKIRHLLGLIDPSAGEALLSELLDDYACRLEQALTGFPLVPGVADIIRSGRFDIFVCSAAPMTEIRSVLAHHGLGQDVTAIFDGTTPKSEALTQIATRYGANCLFVGDAHADQRAAALAGVSFVLRRTGPESASIEADPIIDDFVDFETVIEIQF